MITISLTPEQFAKAQSALRSDKSIVYVGDDKIGSVTTSQISFDYTYDGTNLSMTISGKHGLAKFASDSTIKEHIEALLK
jgi:hypothetical protein